MSSPKPTEVYCIHGYEPEVLAYGMAKYSRSALSLKDSLAEISSQKAGEFLDSFYFAYGHKSIADMAHVPMALENITMLAAIEIVDEPRWDGQERSTRYQDFSQRDFYTPEGLDAINRAGYQAAIHLLFDAYEKLSANYFAHLVSANPCSDNMTEAAYRRTLKARAFDVARYLLPLATKTSVGQITSARTLEGQITRMMTSPYSEVREIAAKMKKAASSASVMPPPESMQGDPAWDADPGPALAPTLVKYTEPSEYIVKSRAAAKRILQEILTARPLLVGFESDLALHSGQRLDLQMLATALYEVSDLSFAAVESLVYGLTATEVDTYIEQCVLPRGRFDELARTWCVGTGITFDIYMDIGGFRDMHRHRRCVQVFQDYSAAEYAVPDPIVGTLMEAPYRETMQEIQESHALLKVLAGADADFILPLGMKRRFLMRMDLAELAYIAELRTGPAGHFSYRNVAYQMYELFAKRYPSLAQHFRVTDVSQPVNMLVR